MEKMPKELLKGVRLSKSESARNFKKAIEGLLMIGCEFNTIADFLNISQSELKNYCRCTAANNIIWFKLSVLIATKQLEKKND